MKFIVSLFLVTCITCAYAQSPITAAEYFIDDDPGIGNATPVAIESGTSVSFDYEVSLDAISPGIHHLHTRVVNDQDIWSLYARRPFFVTAFDFGHTIVAAEYFFDEDPGVGNGIGLSITPGNGISEAFAISLDDLETGIHHLHLRVQNSQQKWSHYARQMFYVLPEYQDAEIVAAEYFIDTDPGPGNGTPIDITPGQSLSESIAITTPEDLTLGDHVVHVRVWTDQEKWSLYARETFTVDEQVGIADLAQNIRLYPNPTADQLYIESTVKQQLSVVIIDMKGHVLETRLLEKNLIDLSHLPSATYIVQVESASGTGFSRKVIKR